MLIRLERDGDIADVTTVHESAFATDDDSRPVEIDLLAALRADAGWLPGLSLVAEYGGEIVGHVVCTRGDVDGVPALGLGPIGVPRRHQGTGIGSAMMHAVLGAADALDEPVVALLGHTGYYPRFGFRPASEFGIIAPDPSWGEHFQVRPLTAYRPQLRGPFRYAAPFHEL